jgi:hypothetical protein
MLDKELFKYLEDIQNPEEEDRFNHSWRLTKNEK